MKRVFPIVILAVALAADVAHLVATGGSGSGSVDLSTSTPVVQDFDTLSNSTSPSTALPNGWYLAEIGTGAAADGAYVAGTGASNAGGAYSFGATASTDRALGSVGSGSVTTIHYGARLTNTGQAPISAVAISYDGELWRRGPSTAPDGLAFSYSTTANDFASTSGFVAVSDLNFTSPGNSCATAAGPTDGNAAPCRTRLSATISGLSLKPGASIWIRWTDVDTTGSDDGVAIDNVTVAATFSTESTAPTATASATPAPVNPGQSISFHGTISTGFNPLSQSFTVTCNLTAVGGSAAQVLPNDGVSFTFTTTVAPQTPLGPNTFSCEVSDDRSRSSLFDIAVVVLLPLNSTCGAPATPISTIQGPTALSPLSGLTVDVEAVVVGDFQGSSGLSGYYVEATTEHDSDPTTSEGLFVFSSSPDVSVGERLRMRGSVSEFSSSTGSLVSHLTELSGVSTVQVCASNQALPEPVDVSLPIDAVAHWEQYEGMLVRFTQQLVVTGNFSLGRFGQIDLAPQVLYQPTQTTGNAVSWGAATDIVKRSLISLDDGSTSSGVGLNGGTVAPYPPPGLTESNTLRVGALVNSSGQDSPTPLIGILDDRFGSYRIQPVDAVSFSNGPNPRPNSAAVAAAVDARFRIVSANVLNFFTTLGSRGAATATEFDHQRTKIVAALSRTGGDVIGLSELQNFENGQTNGGTYTNAAIAQLTSALATATGRNYQYLDTIDPTMLAPGTSVADNGTDAIRSGMIYDVSRLTPVGYPALLYENDQNRPALAQTFRPAGGIHSEQQTFTVVVNHFRSKGSACGAGNDDLFQGNCNGMRLSMANNVATWLDGNPTLDPAGASRRYVLIGDYNAYYGEDPIQALVSRGYTNLINLLIGDKAYSYNFGSQAGYIDHAFVNAAALTLVKDIAELHINADEPAALQALNSAAKSPAAQAAYYGADEFAASDHDPFVIGFNPLQGDFDDNGTLNAFDRVMLLTAIDHGRRGHNATIDRRMDLNGDGRMTQADFLIWQRLFIVWQQGRK
jgi:predicted extracellular nuclease